MQVRKLSCLASKPELFEAVFKELDQTESLANLKMEGFGDSVCCEIVKQESASRIVTVWSKLAN